MGSRVPFPTAWRLALGLIALVMLHVTPTFGAARQAPDFEAVNLDGTRFNLSSERGSVVLLNLRATWCEPCRPAMPELGSLASAFRGAGLLVTGVNIDRTQSSSNISAFAAEHGADFPIVLDPENSFARALRKTGVPETVLIDRSGAIGVAFGASWTPCIGPVLASILTMAAATASVRQGVTLLAVYSLGLAVPFLLATVLLDRFMLGRAQFVVWLPRVERLNGALIILIGALLLTGTLERLASQAARLRAP